MKGLTCLADHRVLCADSGDPEVLDRFYGDVTVGCVLTQSAFGLKPLGALADVPVQLYGMSNGMCWIYRDGTLEQRPLGIFGPRHDGNFADHAVQHVIGALEEFAPEGCIVADPFLGTGTTLLACEATGRICYGIDASPERCAEAARRWKQYR